LFSYYKLPFTLHIHILNKLLSYLDVRMAQWDDDQYSNGGDDYEHDDNQRSRFRKNKPKQEESSWLDKLPTDTQMKKWTDSKFFAMAQKWLLASGGFDLHTAFWAVSMMIVAKSYGSDAIKGIYNNGMNVLSIKAGTSIANKLLERVAEHGQSSTVM
jgi:hypothetical protein